MVLSRVLGAVGRFCIGLGALTLLFVAYQLWGTGILTAQAQNSLENDFESLLTEADDIDEGAIELAVTTEEPTARGDDGGGEDSGEDAGAGDAEPVDPEAAAEAARELELLSNLIWQDAGEPVAQLIIPDIDVDWTVVAGVGTEELRSGPGHYPSTPMPGMAGNASIAGHRTTWGAPFNRIDELEPGDEITVRTIQGTFTYRVVPQESGKGHFIVTPDRVDVLDQDFVEHPNRLTLTACHPKFSARQRIIVVAELVDEPAVTVPRPDGAEVPDAGLASEDVGDGTDQAAADGGLPGDPDLDDGSGTDDANGESEATGADDADSEAEAVADSDGTDDADDTGAEDETEEPDAAAAGGSDPSAAGLQGTAESDFGEGLNGNSEAIFPAIMWGLAAAVILGTAAFVAQRWRRWPTYVLATVPFFLVLFVCFVHIDQALPSY